MDARELADKFSAKVAAAATELHHQETVATDSTKSRLDDVVHIKRAMEQQVIPFLKELEHHFGAKQFSFAPQVDIDHKPVGVSFRIGRRGTHHHHDRVRQYRGDAFGRQWIFQGDCVCVPSRC